jgi:long-chain acyl-CoA synthetase
MINTNQLDKSAIITKDEKISFQEFLINTSKYAELLSGKNYDKIAIYSENRAEWIYAFYAGWFTNCTVVPIDFMASIDDVSYIINDCEPEAIFVSPQLKDNLNQIKTNNKIQSEIFVFEEINLEENPEIFEYTVPEDKEKTAVIIYTSGTTGSPKGVMLSFKNLLANMKAVTEDVEIFREDRQVLVLLPLHHIFPLAGSMMASLYIGSSMVLAPSMQSSDLLETLKNNNVAIMIGVPRLYELLYKGIKAKLEASFIGKIFYKIVKLSNSKKLGRKIFKKVHEGFGGHLEFMVAGGAALNKDVGGFFKTLGFEVLEGFGMTEAAPMITFTRPGKMKIGSPGQVLPGTEVEIRDGEIVAKGDNVMKGYYKRPEETAEVLKDGWLHTGDLGRFDKKGFLFITGRKKEIIILPNGKNVNPVNLEMKLESSSDAISEAGVFLHNEMLHAAILPDFKFFAEKDIKSPEQYFRESVLPEFNKITTSYKRIMKFTIVKEELPRTRLGKLQRFKLNELVENPQKKKTKTKDPACEEYKVVKSFIEKETDMDISPEDNLQFDIGMDSLGKISLIDFVDKSFGVKIDENKLLHFPTIRSMVEYIKDNKIFHKVESINWSETLKEKVHVKLPKTWPTQNIIKHMANVVFRVYFKMKGDGVKNLPAGPCIIAPNHQSYFDGLFVAIFLKNKIFNATYFYAKKKHIKNKFLDFLAKRNNVIVMDLNNELKESIQKMAEVLKQGKKIIIFPEGTRTKTGDIGDFKKTFAILSKELDIPVIPVAIDGAYKALPRGSRFPRPFTKIQVEFLNAVYPETYTTDSLRDEVKQQISQKLVS